MVEEDEQPRHGMESIVPRHERIPMPADAPLVIVPGVIGSGKTTLLRQWFELMDTAGVRRPIWLRVDGRDNDPERLAARLDAELESDPGATTVFVDNFDRVTSEESHQRAVDAVLAAQPHDAGHDAQLVIATTGLPSFPLGPFRAANVVAEIDDEQLCFTRREIEELARRRGVEWSAELGDHLVRLTDGWTAGVVAMLDRLAIDDSPPLHPTIGPILDAIGDDVSRGLIGLVESILPASEVEFLVQTSILDTVTQPLADAVADDGVRADLDRLQRQGLPITRLDRRGEKYRLHPLLQRGLQRRLTELGDRAMAARHGRAGDEYYRSGQLRLAIEHYLAAGNKPRAADLLAVQWSLDRSQVTERELADFEGAGLDRYVPHVVTVGLVRGDRGQLDEVERALAQLTKEQWQGPLPHGFADLDAAIVELEIISPLRDVDRAERVVEVLSRPSGDEVDTSLAARYTVAHHHYYLGRLDEAQSLADEILLGHRLIGRHTRHDRGATVLAAGLNALIEHDRGAVVEARRHYEHSLELTKTFAVTDFFPSALQVRELTRAIVADEEPDVRAALLTDVMDNGADVSLRTHAGIELIRLKDREREYDTAIDLLSRLDESVRGLSLPDMLDERLGAIARTFQQGSSAPGPRMTITPSERFVLHLLVDPDLSQVEIGRVLDLSINTVKSHLRSIYQKFGAANREQALASAADRGLLATILPWEASS